jgi:hypothetical protein
MTTTYGWDLVFVTRASVINAGLFTEAVTVDETVSSTAGPVQVVAELSQWQIAMGGSGGLVNFTIGCPSVSLTHDKKTLTFTHGSFLFQTSLRWQGGTPTPQGQPSSMVLSPFAGAGMGHVLGASFSDPTFAGFEHYAVAAIQQWADAETAFDLVLATVASAAAGDGVSSTLAPSPQSYAYADLPGSRTEGVLGLLCTVLGRPAPSGLLPEVATDALGVNDAVVLLSEQLVSDLTSGFGSALTLPGAQSSSATISAPLSVPITIART